VLRERFENLDFGNALLIIGSLVFDHFDGELLAIINVAFNDLAECPLAEEVVNDVNTEGYYIMRNYICFFWLII
jgi:hypothetical protein